MGSGQQHVQQGDQDVRAVLSLADALEAEEAHLQHQVGGIKELPMHEINAWGSACDVPTVGQTTGAVVDGWTLNVGTLSHPPLTPAKSALGSPELPSVGSSDHAMGCCRPCAFLHTK